MEISESFPSRPSELEYLLLDLDGTLVSMRSKRAELVLMARVARRFAPVVSMLRFPDYFWSAARRMLENESPRHNFDVLVDALCEGCAWDREQVLEQVDAFIDEDFPRIAPLVQPIEGARELFERAQALGLSVVLATNPVWPERAVKNRLRWGGMEDCEFAFVTHSQNMTRCKPSPAYYAELLAHLGTSGESCLMVGNDPRKDLPASEAGIPTYLIARSARRRRRVLEDPRTGATGTLRDLIDWLGDGAATAPSPGPRITQHGALA